MKAWNGKCPLQAPIMVPRHDGIGVDHTLRVYPENY
jgi:hypothetical protein